MKPLRLPPKVTIILPTYNRQTFLERAISSILQQTYTDYELIIVDDGSTDDTVAWMQATYPQLKLLVKPQNQGTAAAINTGLQAALGEIIAFLDSDDLWEAQYLNTQVQSLANHPQAVLSYTQHFSIVEGTQSACCMDITPLYPNDLIVSMLMSNFIRSMSHTVIPRWALEQVGPLDSRYKICHDQDLYLRLLAIGQPIYVKTPLVIKFWHPGSLVTADAQRWLADGLQLFEIFFSNPANAAYLPWRDAAQQYFRDSIQPATSLFTPPQPDRRAPLLNTPVEPAAYASAPDLWIITCYFNPSHYQTKYRNYQRFKTHIEAAGLNLLTVECAFSSQSFDLEPSAQVLQVRCPHVLWQKERLLNLAIAALPTNATKIAWLDCDILFANPNWAQETAALLDEFPVVQPFTLAIRLPANSLAYTGKSERISTSFTYAYAAHQKSDVSIDFNRFGHTGYAWAARREILDRHGLYDRAIIGSADHLMAHAMIGDFTSFYVQRFLGSASHSLAHFSNWGQALYQDVQGQMGYAAGTVLHLWHGDFNDRHYLNRHDVLMSYDFDPELDVVVGPNGTLQWHSNKPKLHEWVIDYFNQRQEDRETEALR
jgi:GT2 family glycosyltransferase